MGLPTKPHDSPYRHAPPRCGRTDGLQMPWSPSAAPPENDRAAAVLSPNLMSRSARAATRRHLGRSGSRDAWALRALRHPKLQAARLKQQERHEASFGYMVKWLNHAPPSRGVINASVPLGYTDMQGRQPHLLPPLVHWPWATRRTHRRWHGETCRPRSLLPILLRLLKRCLSEDASTFLPLPPLPFLLSALYKSCT